MYLPRPISCGKGLGKVLMVEEKIQPVMLLRMTSRAMNTTTTASTTWAQNRTQPRRRMAAEMIAQRAHSRSVGGLGDRFAAIAEPLPDAAEVMVDLGDHSPVLAAKVRHTSGIWRRRGLGVAEQHVVQEVASLRDGERLRQIVVGDVVEQVGVVPRGVVGRMGADERRVCEPRLVLVVEPIEEGVGEERRD